MGLMMMMLDGRRTHRFAAVNAMRRPTHTPAWYIKLDDRQLHLFKQVWSRLFTASTVDLYNIITPQPLRLINFIAVCYVHNLRRILCIKIIHIG